MNIEFPRTRVIMLAGLLFAGGCAATAPQRPAVTIVPTTAQQPQPLAMAMAVPPTTAPAGSESNLFGLNLTNSLVGKKCRLQFRRDALGLSAPGVLEPTATSSGGKATSIVGIVDQVSDVWLVVKVNQQLYWVPVQQVLMVEVVE